MANKEHRLLTDPNIHEPKNMSTAVASSSYIASGSGTGVWTPNTNKFFLNFEIPDISTASTHYIPIPVAGNVTKIWVAISGAITLADAIITPSVTTGAAMTTGAVTIAFTGSAAGSVFSSTPSALNAVVAGDYCKFVGDGGSTDVSVGVVTFEITLV